ncbi:hypothetical protein BKA64DRAFT_773373, partial [Cadophora sp. MPI-SDFR-AT-0126]
VQFPRQVVLTNRNCAFHTRAVYTRSTSSTVTSQAFTMANYSTQTVQSALIPVKENLEAIWEVLADRYFNYMLDALTTFRHNTLSALVEMQVATGKEIDTHKESPSLMCTTKGVMQVIAKDIKSIERIAITSPNLFSKMHIAATLKEQSEKLLDVIWTPVTFKTEPLTELSETINFRVEAVMGALDREPPYGIDESDMPILKEEVPISCLMADIETSANIRTSQPAALISQELAASGSNTRLETPVDLNSLDDQVSNGSQRSASMSPEAANENIAIPASIPSLNRVPEPPQSILEVLISNYRPVETQQHRPTDIRRSAIRSAAWNRWLSAEAEAEDPIVSNELPQNKTTSRTEIPVLQNEQVITLADSNRTKDVLVWKLNSKQRTVGTISTQPMIHKLPPKPPASVCVGPITTQTRSSNPIRASQKISHFLGPEKIQGHVTVPPNDNAPGTIGARPVTNVTETGAIITANHNITPCGRGPDVGHGRLLKEVINESNELIKTLQEIIINPPSRRAELSHTSTIGSSAIEIPIISAAGSSSHVMEIDDDGEPDRQSPDSNKHARATYAMATSPSHILGEDHANLSDSGSDPMDLDSDDEITASDGKDLAHPCSEGRMEDVPSSLSRNLDLGKIGSREQSLPLRGLSLPPITVTTPQDTPNVSVTSSNADIGKSTRDPEPKSRGSKNPPKRDLTAKQAIPWGLLCSVLFSPYLSASLLFTLLIAALSPQPRPLYSVTTSPSHLISLSPGEISSINK